MAGQTGQDEATCLASASSLAVSTSINMLYRPIPPAFIRYSSPFQELVGEIAEDSKAHGVGGCGRGGVYTPFSLSDEGQLFLQLLV